MIEIKNLCKSYDDKQVLKDLNITIENGKIFGLVGINGAGKSTLLRLMSGIFEPNNGSIKYDGDEVFENEKVKKEPENMFSVLIMSKIIVSQYCKIITRYIPFLKSRRR